MSMTKKDYQIIANIIVKLSIESDMTLDTVTENRLYVADMFAHELAKINDKFDKDKFLTACGVK